MVKFDSEMYEYPSIEDYEKKFAKIYAVIFAVGIVFAGLFAFFLMSESIVGFDGINAQINEDFWFEGNMLYTSDGWSFTMTKVQDYSIDCIVLAFKTYSKNEVPYRPINMFSPIDLYVGIDDLKENVDDYPYEVTSYHDRVGYTKFNGGNADWSYFRAHSTNIHIIPHNKEVFNGLRNISLHDLIILEGSLVNLYGTRGDQNYYWNTDTTIGNYDCEVMLVDSINIVS
jgi:hypothetical protein